MRVVELTEFGFREKKFLCEGNVVVKNDGKKLLFLFAETHKRTSSIGPNVRNCVRLTDDGIVGFVGLEFNPADEIDPPKYARTDDLAADVEAIMKADLEKVREPRFGTTVRRLVDPPVEVVENMELWTKTDEIESQIKERHIGRRQSELFRKLKEENPEANNLVLDQQARRQAEADEDVIRQFRDEFGDHTINKDRDNAMVAKLLERWAEVGNEKAAVLNAGRKHIERIKSMLPPDVRLISVVQPE